MKVNYHGHANESGVYKITNTVNGKIYIGSAKLFKVRANQHKNSLKHNKHRNKHLQASWDKHGAAAFLFEVIEVVSGDRLARTTREQFFVNQELGDWEMCFNFKKKTFSNEGPWSHTPEETRRKLAKTLGADKEKYKKIAKKRYAENKEVMDACMQRGREFCKTKEFKLWQSKRSKKKWEDPEYREKISEARKKMWKTTEYREKMLQRNKEMWAVPEHRAMMSKSSRGNTYAKKMYVFMNPEGEEIIITNLARYCRENNLCAVSMYRLCRGQTLKTRKGWMFKRKHT